MDLCRQLCDLGRLADILVVLVNGVFFPLPCGPVTSRLGYGVILLDDSTCRLVLELLEYIVAAMPSTLLTRGKKTPVREVRCILGCPAGGLLAVFLCRMPGEAMVASLKCQ